MNRLDFLKNIKQKLPINPICIEIGVLDGSFARYIFDIINPSILYLVDPWQVGYDKNSPIKVYSGPLNGQFTAYSTNYHLNKTKHKFLDEINKKQVVIKKQFSYDAVKDFNDQYFDFIYIDATHIYESVKADLISYYPKLKYGGFICGHDYIDHPSFSVIRAVDEFKNEYNGNMILLSDDGDFAISFNN